MSTAAPNLSQPKTVPGHWRISPTHTHTHPGGLPLVENYWFRVVNIIIGGTKNKIKLTKTERVERGGVIINKLNHSFS